MHPRAVVNHSFRLFRVHSQKEKKGNSGKTRDERKKPTKDDLKDTATAEELVIGDIIEVCSRTITQPSPSYTKSHSYLHTRETPTHLASSSRINPYPLPRLLLFVP
jgi:hypothetical protein